MFDLAIPCAFFDQLPLTLRFKEQTMLHIIIVKVVDLFFSYLLTGYAELARLCCSSAADAQEENCEKNTKV